MSTDTEKGARDEITPINNVDSGDAVNIDEDEVYSYEEQRKIIHRVDRRLLPACGLALFVSLVGRTNVGMAAIAGYVLGSSPKVLTDCALSCGH